MLKQQAIFLTGILLFLQKNNFDQTVSNNIFCAYFQWNLESANI